jgi:hypothetical protein
VDAIHLTYGRNPTRKDQRSKRNKPQDIAIVAGKVSTQATPISDSVERCSPAPEANIVPAMPPVTTWVVLTG